MALVARSMRVASLTENDTEEQCMESATAGLADLGRAMSRHLRRAAGATLLAAPMLAAASVPFATQLHYVIDPQVLTLDPTWDFTAIGPAQPTGVPAAFVLPVQSVSVDAGHTLTSVSSTGGVEWTVGAGQYFTGGTVRFTNIRIDTASSTVFADFWGSNGVGSVEDIALFQFSWANGSQNLPASLWTAPDPAHPAVAATSILSFTPSSHALIAASLGETDYSWLFALPSAGAFAFTATPSVAMPVPEPEAVLMWLAGLGVLLGATGRASLRRG